MGKLGFVFLDHFIAYYGLMIVIGILVNMPIAYIQMKRFQLDINDFIIICSILGFFGIVGAKILYFLVSWKNIDFYRLNDFSYLNSLMSGGFVFLGGIIGILPAMILCHKKLHIYLQPYIQACMGCIPIGHAFGRIGCFLVGCCYGVPYNGVLAITYIDSLFAPNGIPLFPVQLVEAVIEFILGICLLVFSKKLNKYSSLLIYLLAYSLVRFLLEFLRYDKARGIIAGISTSQILSLLLFISVSFCLLRSYKNEK